MIEVRIDDGDLVCDWGVIEFGDPRPERGEIGPLILATADYVRELSAYPHPQCAKNSRALHQITRDGDRLFAHVFYFGKHWKWELFEAYMADGLGPDIFVGKLVPPWWKRFFRRSPCYVTVPIVCFDGKVFGRTANGMYELGAIR